jgi:hypothetical protein
MNRRDFVSGCLLSAGTLASAVAIAQGPERNVGRRHPNLEAAQRLAQQAYERILDAQRANEFDLGGHAQRAKELLEQASQQLKEAAMASNRDHR